MPSQMSTAVTTGGMSGGVVLTGAVQAAYSQEILHAAQPVRRFAQFAEVKTELGRQPGNQINFLRYGDLDGSAVLTEGTDMETDALDSSLIPITVGERGKAVRVSELLLNTSFDDVMATATVKLGQHYAQTIDGELRNALRGTPNMFRVGGAATRAAMTSANVAVMDTIRSARTQLAENKAPKFDDDYYICFVSPHQAASIRRDPEWVSVVKYGDPDRVYRGEIGRIEDVRFIETTNTTVIKSGAYVDEGAVFADNKPAPDVPDETDFHATLDVHQAYMFGANSVGIAEALPAELRDNGVEDFGRKHSLGWYAIYGVARIEDANSIVIESV